MEVPVDFEHTIFSSGIHSRHPELLPWGLMSKCCSFDTGLTLGQLWASCGPTLGQLCGDFAPTLGQLWADLGPTLRQSLPGLLCAVLSVRWALHAQVLQPNTIRNWSEDLARTGSFHLWGPEPDGRVKLRRSMLHTVRHGHMLSSDSAPSILGTALWYYTFCANVFRQFLGASIKNINQAEMQTGHTYM